MSKYEELRKQTEDADGEQLSRLGALVWKAYEAGEITNEQLHQLDDVWRRRITELGGIRLVSAYEALSGTIRSAHDEATLRAPGPAAWRAFELKQITGDELHLLVRQSVRRAAELGISLEVLSGPAGASDVIPLANLGRLSLQTGDTLIVVAPADYGDLAAMRTLAGLVQQQLDEAHSGCHVLVVPNGATLGVLAKEQA